jgi:phospholipid/cholesterol/gamma-HCH transport system substrate-binding protein
MSDKRTAIRIGVFTFASAALVAVVLVTFAGLNFWRRHDRYYVEIDGSVIGLSRGTNVYFDGIEVGSVDNIALSQHDLGRVRVAIDLDRGTPMRTDTKALIRGAGLTGLKTIDLQGGAIGAPPLPVGATLVASESGLDRLQAQADRLADQSERLMTRLNKVVDNVEQATSPEQLGAIVASTRETTANLARATHAAAALVADNRTAVHDAVAALARASDNANQVATDIRTLLRTNQGSIIGILADARQAARTFKELAREVRDKPSRLVFSTSPPERKLP